MATRSRTTKQSKVNVFGPNYLQKYAHGVTHVQIEGCPTPKNWTVDLIQYGWVPAPQPVHEGNLSLFLLPAKYCEEYLLPLICQKYGHLMRTYYTHVILIRVSQPVIAYAIITYHVLEKSWQFLQVPCLMWFSYISSCGCSPNSSITLRVRECFIGLCSPYSWGISNSNLLWVLVIRSHNFCELVKDILNSFRGHTGFGSWLLSMGHFRGALCFRHLVLAMCCGFEIWIFEDQSIGHQLHRHFWPNIRECQCTDIWINRLLGHWVWYLWRSIDEILPSIPITSDFFLEDWGILFINFCFKNSLVSSTLAARTPRPSSFTSTHLLCLCACWNNGLSLLPKVGFNRLQLLLPNISPSFQYMYRG